MSISPPPPATASDVDLARPLSQLGRGDVGYAGGKGANLGELVGAGLPVPDGFVVGAPAYAAFCAATGLRERLAELLDGVDIEDTDALSVASLAARDLVSATPVPEAVQREIRASYERLGGAEGDAPVAVRSSATAEDTAETSFAGMNETFLNVRGADAVIDAVRRCWRSLFGTRTIYYRGLNGLGQADMDIAVVVQRQIPSTRAGVMFTVNPATGDANELVIEGSFGLGEAVVSGSVSPDRYLVEKDPLTLRRREVHLKELAIEYDAQGGTSTRHLSRQEALMATLDDREVLAVAELGLRIERHYGSPQDTEWAFDPEGGLWMLQSRPITTLHAEQVRAAGATADGGNQPEPRRPQAVLLRGLGGAPGRASGPARVLASLADGSDFADGDVLVTHMTSPDWLPLLRRASAVVTDSGGMTCHAAIVSRELGIPCVVGTAEATHRLRDRELITVDATRGVVLEGPGEDEPSEAVAERGPVAPGALAPAPAPNVTATQILVNLSEPSQVERVKDLPVDGVGLLRAEMMVLEALAGDHPRTLLEEGRGEDLVARMTESLDVFAAGFAPRPVTYRTIDFRTNEFAGLRGGERVEPGEANPMIGYRGALRYTREPDLFALELEAVRRVWDAGRRNLHVMLPFVRSTRELRRCRDLMAETGLLDRPGFELWVMAEVPSVLFNLADYAELGVRGISIGSNDLTQLLLGADRDNEVLAETFDERDPAVTSYLRELIPRARELGMRTSICGQAPSVHPEYAELLVRAGIDAISVNVDVIGRTRALVSSAEQRVVLEAARSHLAEARRNAAGAP
ncbi:MAG: phosphoenolpyruvate synthase [Solirubrobacteraceae bacterium]